MIFAMESLQNSCLAGRWADEAWIFDAFSGDYPGEGCGV